MPEKTQKTKKVSFMLVPLTAGEKRMIKRRLTEREPVVFVEPSASTRMKDSSNPRNKTGLTTTQPVVFLNSAFHKKEKAEVNVSFGSSSTQRRQKEEHRQNEAPVSAPGEEAPRRPTNSRRTKKVPRQRERKGKAPSEDGKKPKVKPVDLVSCVQHIVDRLSPETFQDSLTQLKKLRMETEENLKAAIAIIFERATLRPNSSALYANLCHCLSYSQVSTTAEPTASVSFKTLLIRQCQVEFEQNHGRDDTFERQQETAKDDDTKTSCRSLNNIRFIGELFKSKVLSTAVMHSCIKRLLNHQDEESLECLCELFKTVGKDLEVATAKRDMDLFFQRMESIRKEGKTSLRVCLILKETADLRQRNWFSGVNKGTKSQPSTSEPADPATAPGQTGSESQAEDAVSEPADPTTVEERPQLTQDKKDDGDHQLQLEREDTVPTGPHPVTPSHTEDDMETISEYIIYQYKTTNNLEEAIHHVMEQTSTSLLHVFVRSAVDLSLECSSDFRRNVGLLLLEMHKSGVLPAAQIFKGLKEILEVADYVTADLPDIWLWLAEIIGPMILHQSVSMAELCGNIQTLLPLTQTRVLMGHILSLTSTNNPSSTPPASTPANTQLPQSYPSWNPTIPPPTPFLPSFAFYPSNPSS